MDYSPPGSSVYTISQARIPEWVPISSPRDLLNPAFKPGPPALAGEFSTTESPGEPMLCVFLSYLLKDGLNKHQE